MPNYQIGCSAPLDLWTAVTNANASMFAQLIVKYRPIEELKNTTVQHHNLLQQAMICADETIVGALLGLGFEVMNVPGTKTCLEILMDNVPIVAIDDQSLQKCVFRSAEARNYSLRTAHSSVTDQFVADLKRRVSVGVMIRTNSSQLLSAVLAKFGEWNDAGLQIPGESIADILRPIDTRNRFSRNGIFSYVIVAVIMHFLIFLIFSGIFKI